MNYILNSAVDTTDQLNSAPN